MCKLEPEAMEQTDIPYLWLVHDVVLLLVDNLYFKETGLESSLRAF
jgi:hypothetical protein